VIPVAAIDRTEMSRALGLMEQDYTKWELVFKTEIDKDMGWTSMGETAPIIDEENNRVHCVVRRIDPSPLMDFVVTYDFKAGVLLHAFGAAFVIVEPGMARLNQSLSIRRRYCISVEEDEERIYVWDRGNPIWKSPVIGTITMTGDRVYTAAIGGPPVTISLTGRYVAAITYWWFLLVWEGRR